MEQFLKVLAAVGFGSLVVGLSASLVNYLLGRRKADVEDKDVVITGAEKIVVASGDVIDQLRVQMTWLSTQHVQCMEDNITIKKDNLHIREQNVALTERVVNLERNVARLEREAANGR